MESAWRRAQRKKHRTPGLPLKIELPFPERPLNQGC